MDKKITSLQYFEFVQKQLVHESVEQIIENGLMNLGALIENYLPLNVKNEKQQAIFEILVTLLQKEGLPKDPIVDSLFSFLAHKEHI